MSVPVTYTDRVKYEAMELWAEHGMSYTDIARELGVKASVISRWRKQKQPMNWDAVRAEVERKAQDEVLRRLTARRATTIEQHFNDLERLRQAALLAASEPVYEMGPDGTPRKDANGDPVVRGYRPRAMRTREVKDLTSAYRDIQHGQRLALGIPADYTATVGIGGASDNPADVIAELGLSDAAIEAIGDEVAEHLIISIEADVRHVDGQHIEDLVDELADEDA